MSEQAFRLVEGYHPGVVARVVGLHMAYYAPAWGFGQHFETKVATEFSAFLARFDADADFLLSAYNDNGAMLGSVTLDGHAAAGEGAHLRWFITSDGARGTGLGRKLLERAIAFADGRGYETVYLTTFAGLEAARHLYEATGFRLVMEAGDDQWQGGVREQRFERTRPRS